MHWKWRTIAWVLICLFLLFVFIMQTAENFVNAFRPIGWFK